MGKETKDVPKRRTNYPQKKNSSTPAKKSSSKKQPVKPKLPPISPYRQRIMSDEKIRFFYSEEGGQFHDKSCHETRKIPDEKLRFSGDYRTDLPQCDLCKVKAYVRLGAKDFYNLSSYEKLFERMDLTPDLLRQMYVQEGMQTTAGADCLTIWGKEDTWRLELMGPGNTLRLMHNNYYGTPDGGRRFTPGYHVQLEPVSAKYAIATIAGYTYEGHKAAVARREQEMRERQRRLDMMAAPVFVSIEEPSNEESQGIERGGKLRQFFAWFKYFLSKFLHK